MTLSKEDGKLFFKLFFPLLNYVNAKKKVNPNLPEMSSDVPLNFADVKEVANVLWGETSLIDEYLADNRNIDGDEREIILGWKRCVRDKFVIERHLRKGSVFIRSENEEVYLVLGITSTWEEMTYFARLPMIIEAVLIPFRSVIITDGIILPYNVVIGRNMAKSFKDIYMNAKQSGKIHNAL